MNRKQRWNKTVKYFEAKYHKADRSPQPWWTDPDKIQQVFQPLIDACNAAKE